MNKEEFKSSMQSINSYRAEAKRYLDSYKIHLNNINLPDTVVGKIAERDSLYAEYLDYINQYAYADSMVYPTDLFPGIGISSEELQDPKKIQQKTQEMKQVYSDILADNQIIQLQSKWLQDELRAMLDDLSEYITISNQVYDMEEDLLRKMDSIYDIGRFARNT